MIISTHFILKNKKKMWLSLLLIVVVTILLGLFVNYLFAKLSTCEECAKKKKSLSAWDNLQEQHGSSDSTDTDTINDILGS